MREAIRSGKKPKHKEAGAPCCTGFLEIGFDPA
jgi:hypothetical protein